MKLFFYVMLSLGLISGFIYSDGASKNSGTSAINQKAIEWIYAMDVIQIGYWLVLVIGAWYTIHKVRADLYMARLQNKQDLNWKRAEAAKALNDEMLDDKYAYPALKMIDYPSGREYEIPGLSKTCTINSDHVLSALNPAHFNLKESEIFIRDCYDSLFYYFALFEHNINTGLIASEDIRFPSDYYIERMSKNKFLYKKYLAQFGLSKAEAFLNRFSVWKTSNG